MWQRIWAVSKEILQAATADDVLTKAAALAFYCSLGLAPIMLLVLAFTAWLGPQGEEMVTSQIESTVGGQAAKGVNDVVRSAKQEQRREASGSKAAIVGMITVLFSASGIFGQLQASLNDIWGVKPKPKGTWWNWLRARLLSMATLLSVLFLLFVSLAVSTGLAFAFSGELLAWGLVNFAVSLLLYVALFALIYKLLPDATMRWRDVWIGAALTAVLFAVGKQLIGIYLGRSAVASSYGAAGSLVALIVWVYYSAIIFFVGAEVTKTCARRFGAGIKPDKYAVLKDCYEA